MTHCSASRPPTPSAPATSAIPSTEASVRSVTQVSTPWTSSAIHPLPLPLPNLPPSCSFSSAWLSLLPRAPSPSPANHPNSRISRNLYIGGRNFLRAPLHPSHLWKPKRIFFIPSALVFRDNRDSGIRRPSHPPPCSAAARTSQRT